MPYPWWLVVLLVVSFVPQPARAAGKVDVIYPDSVLYAGFSGGVDKIIWGGISFALIVNGGESAITSDDLAGATFEVTSSRDSFWLSIDAGVLSAWGPIGPSEALGAVAPPNTVLTGLLAPGESLRNTAPNSVIYSTTWRVYEGPDSADVPFDILMRLGGEEVKMHTVVKFRRWSLGVIYYSPHRITSSTLTPVVATSWGRLKTLYR